MRVPTALIGCQVWRTAFDYGAFVFDDGSAILVGVDAQFESWHLSGHGVDDVLGGPGGDVDWQRPD